MSFNQFILKEQYEIDERTDCMGTFCAFGKQDFS